MEKELLNTFDKELLIRDLCTRLPYGVKVESVFINTDTKKRKSCGIEVFDATCILMIRDGFGEFKPYLFPLSSMTEEELKEFQACHCVYDLHPDFQPIMCNIANEQNMFDWLNAHHFDYRGLISMGLAIDATGLNIY